MPMSEHISRLLLLMAASDHVHYALKTPYRDGTTHIVLEPLDLMARLAALPLPAAGGGWQVIAKSGPRHHFHEPRCIRASAAIAQDSVS